MSETLKIAITGASGFIGQHLLEDISHTSFSVRIITRNPLKTIGHVTPETEIIKADLKDLGSLKKAFAGIDVIVNIAAEVRNDKLLADTNIEGTKNLIKAATENKVKKIIHLSSVGVVGMQYSDCLTHVSEETECAPKNEYERTKLESEKLLLDADKKNNWQLTILRPTNVFGENHPYNALLHLMNHIHSEKPTVCTRLAKVNYLYVKDLSQLIVKLISDEKEYGIVNVGQHKDLNAFVKLISAELGKKPKMVIIPPFLIKISNLVGINILKSVSNGVIYQDEKLKCFYKYPFGIEQGLRNTIEYYKKQNLIK
jgi:nucleoside-diphosphate-sugar epimerase